MDAPLFIADVHLGRLARMLRMLGFDTVYDAFATRPQLLKAAVTGHRVLLTRNTALAANPFLNKLVLATADPEAQLAQVLDHYSLFKNLKPFTRCMVCNHALLPVSKEAVQHRLQPATQTDFDEFWQCPNCSRVYWQGSHYKRMIQLVQRLSTR